MQPAAKKCLWWAGASAAVGVALQVSATAIMNTLYDTWLVGGVLAGVPGWVPVMNSLLAVLTQLPLLIAAALVGAAAIINVLAPRGHGLASAVPATTDDTPERRDAVGIAETSAYTPPRS